jgi:hypothetical protein
MTPQHNHLPLPELARQCAAFHKKLSCLVDDLSSLEERSGRLELEYLQLVEKMGMLPAVQACTALAGKAGTRSPDSRRMMQKKAAEGVGSLKLVAQAGGAVLAQLDGRAGMRLPPELAVLLAVLTEEGGGSPDHLVPWRSQETVKGAMLSRTGKKFSKKAVHQLVYRLRELLAAHGENRFYVMSDRERGYRFALRRNPATVTQPVTTRHLQ